MSGRFIDRHRRRMLSSVLGQSEFRGISHVESHWEISLNSQLSLLSS
jgi:hypothetical protein